MKSNEGQRNQNDDERVNLLPFAMLPPRKMISKTSLNMGLAPKTRTKHVGRNIHEDVDGSMNGGRGDDNGKACVNLVPLAMMPSRQVVSDMGDASKARTKHGLGRNNSLEDIDTMPTEILEDHCQDAHANRLQRNDLSKSSMKIGIGQEKDMKEGVWKLRKTGMFYKRVMKALKEEEEREKAVAASQSYRVWLRCAPDGSSSDQVNIYHAPKARMEHVSRNNNHKDVDGSMNGGQSNDNGGACMNVVPLPMIPSNQVVSETSLDTSGDASKAIAENGVGGKILEGVDRYMPTDILEHHYQAAHGDGLQRNDLPKGISPDKDTKEGVWKLRKTGMFYKRVMKALKDEEEREKVVAASQSYKVWLHYAPDGCSSDQVNNEDPIPKAHKK